MREQLVDGDFVRHIRSGRMYRVRRALPPCGCGRVLGQHHKAPCVFYQWRKDGEGQVVTLEGRRGTFLAKEFQKIIPQ